jgi:hypothetical protein
MLEPPLAEISPGHFAACHRAHEFCGPAPVSPRA